RALHPFPTRRSSDPVDSVRRVALAALDQSFSSLASGSSSPRIVVAGAGSVAVGAAREAGALADEAAAVAGTGSRSAWSTDRSSRSEEQTSELQSLAY